MNITTFSLEIGLGVLLVAVLIYSIRLDRKLYSLRDGQAELAKIVAELNQAASRAEAGVRALKQASEGAGHALDTQMLRARALGDELKILTELGEARAARMAITPSRTAPSVVVRDMVQPQPVARAPMTLSSDGDDLFEEAPRKRTEADWARALRQVR